MAPVLKTGIPETVSGVRIPSLPPFFLFLYNESAAVRRKLLRAWLSWLCRLLFGCSRPCLRRDGRVAEGARLESVYRLIPYRGFESPSLRHFRSLFDILRGGFEPVRPEGRTSKAENPPLSELFVSTCEISSSWFCLGSYF